MNLLEVYGASATFGKLECIEVSIETSLVELYPKK